MNARSRADTIVLAWSTLTGERHCTVLEPGESGRWARVAERWNRDLVGEWTYVGTEPMRDVEFEIRDSTPRGER